MANPVLHHYINGNAEITLHQNGTRIIRAPDELKLQYPLNIDIRVSSRCAFGLNRKTNRAICDFCHESATTDGQDADLNSLLDKLRGLPAGIELAVGANELPLPLLHFFEQCKGNGWIVNCTINQGHLRRDRNRILDAIQHNLICGLGISYRPGMIDIDPQLLSYGNTVVHVIAGINTIEQVKSLASQGVRKILVLGEKDFGFNLGKVRITTDSHRAWYRQVHELFKLFEVVSFDNLALEQLNVRRFVKHWDQMYQHEYSFYINAVDQYFAPSSRSADTVSYNGVTVQQYFKKLFPEFA